MTWEKIAKQHLFEIIDQKGLEVTNLSIETGHDRAWLSRIKSGAKQLRTDQDLIPLLKHLDVNLESFFQKVAQKLYASNS